MDTNNYIDCLKLETIALTDQSINVKNKKIYNHLLQNTFDQPNFTELKSLGIKKMFNTIDNFYFDNKIANYSKDKHIQINFKVYNNINEIEYVSITKNTELLYEICASTNIINDLFNCENKVDKITNIYGQKCVDRLECMIQLMQHEIIHLVLMLFREDNHMTHSPIFSRIVQNHFGQTECKHIMSYYNDAVSTDKVIDKPNVNIGDDVVSKMIQGNIYKGIVIKINHTSVSIKLDSGTLIDIYFNCINKITKSGNTLVHKNLLKVSEKNILKNIKKGNQIKVLIDNQIMSGTVTHLIPKKARVKMTNGKEWYIPYESILF
jgi:sRNA-binding protein